MQDEIVKMSGIQTKNRLYIIGNGFDLAHGLPTRYNPDFKEVATRNETNNLFWELYQSENPDIWSDFENLLAKPDFDSLSEIFNGYYPDYTSDHESDRDSIITQTDISGKLGESLYEFASNAERTLKAIKPITYYEKLFSAEARFLSFNYTHTLEDIYGIQTEKILHIHGEVGGDNKLIMGYDVTDFNAGTISEDVTGHGQYRSLATAEHIDQIEDSYVRTAYENLLGKIKSWEKPIQKDKLLDFINKFKIDEVIVIGFSFGKVDAAYFDLIQQKFSDCRFIIAAHNNEVAESYAENIKKYYKINNYTINMHGDIIT